MVVQKDTSQSGRKGFRHLLSLPLLKTSLATNIADTSNVQSSGGSGSHWDHALGTDGGGNIDIDPLFMDVSKSDLRLQNASPAIDAGDNSAVPEDITTDLAGNPRFMDNPVVDTGNGTSPIVDMGAYENDLLCWLSPCSTPTNTPTITPTATATPTHTPTPESVSPWTVMLYLAGDTGSLDLVRNKKSDRIT